MVVEKKEIKLVKKETKRGLKLTSNMKSKFGRQIKPNTQYSVESSDEECKPKKKRKAIVIIDL